MELFPLIFNPNKGRASLALHSRRRGFGLKPKRGSTLRNHLEFRNGPLGASRESRPTGATGRGRGPGGEPWKFGLEKTSQAPQDRAQTHPFFGWEGSPTRIENRKKGTLILSSLLEDLARLLHRALQWCVVGVNLSARV